MKKIMDKLFIVREFNLSLFFIFAPMKELLELVRLKNIENTLVNGYSLSEKDFLLMYNETLNGLDIRISENPSAYVKIKNEIKIIRRKSVNK